jgi:hypothetical protein
VRTTKIEPSPAPARLERRGQEPGSFAPLFWWIAVAGVILLSLGLNLWSIDHGLPQIYNPDERAHFVPKAVRFFASGGFDPDYYLNPPGFTYLLYGVFWAWFGGGEKVLSATWQDIFLVARVTAAILGSLSVLLVYLVGGRFFNRRVGLVSAALMAVAFLPVYQSKLAVNDVPALVPVSLALLGAGGILRSGRRIDYLLAGGGVGLAVATKYTAGMVLLAVLTAAAFDLHRRRHEALPAVALGAFCAVGAFVLANPYSVLDPQEYFSSLDVFSVTPPGSRKLGQAELNGFLHYLWVFSWGFGWLPSLTAIAGAVLMVRRNLIAAVILIPAPVLYLVFMGMRGGFISRYMLPAFPFVAILAGYGLCALAQAILARHRRFLAGGLVVGLMALSAQSIVHDVHVGFVRTRTNTRERALDWMLANVPSGTKVAVEPINMFPEDPRIESVATIERRQLSPWRLFHWTQPYLSSLNPALLDVLQRRGVCWVVTGTSQKGRALSERERLPQAIAYYEALEQRGELVFRSSPYKVGAEAVPFNFDWSNNHYPLAYERPGPEIDVYRLREKNCS